MEKQTLISKIIKGNLPNNFKQLKISSDAKDLIEKMLQFSPNKRISITDIARHSWIANVSGNHLD